MGKEQALFVTGLLLVTASACVAASAYAATENHCVAVLAGHHPDGELILEEPRCHATFAAAIADASSGRVMLPESTPGSAVLTDASLAEDLAGFALGVHYDGANGTGSSITITGSSCGGGYWNTGSTWANRISSSYNGCARLRHYDGPHRSGATEDTRGAGTTDNLINLNNRAESVSYHSS